MPARERPLRAIAAVAPHRADGPGGSRGADVVEGRGRLLVPSFSDVHTHLDSTRLGLPFRPHTATPGIWNMVLNDREHWRQAEWPVAQRASHTLGLMIARGTTRVRSYAQVDMDCGLERLEAVWAYFVKKADAVAFCAHFQGPQMGPLDAVDPATLAALGVTRLEGAALGKLDGQALAPAPQPLVWGKA